MPHPAVGDRDLADDGVARQERHSLRPLTCMTVQIAFTAAELAAKRAAIMQHRSQTTDLVEDDPDGFRIDAALLERWLGPVERFYRASGR